MVKRLLLILLSLTMVCGGGASELNTDAPLRPEIKRIEAPALENFFKLSTNLYSGSSPDADESFAALEKLGIKTIITVDGAKPAVERAHAHGMRYIHLPHGYDGIPRDIQLDLIKAAQTAKGPIYIHCHHGQHRGPVAAATICMSLNDWSHGEAKKWLRTVGTGTNYQGLYATVRNFQKPTLDALESRPANFPESRNVSGLVDSMVSIDETFDRLKSLLAAPPSNTPDNHLLNEATLLREHFRESQRLPESQKRGSEFMKSLLAAENDASTFEEALTSSTDRARLDRAFKTLANSCVSCHRAYRDDPASRHKSASPLGR